MDWKECLHKEIITKVQKDTERSDHLLRLALTRFEFWDMPVKDKYVSIKVEAYYEIIKELIFSILYRNGFNCRNHLCLIAYLREHHSDISYEIDKIDELRHVRNEISYRGFTIRQDYLNRNELEFKNIIEILQRLARPS